MTYHDEDEEGLKNFLEKMVSDYALADFEIEELLHDVQSQIELGDYSPNEELTNEF